jgi:exopolysaccharide production protein ExoQ
VNAIMPTVTSRAPVRILSTTALLYPFVAILAPKAMVVLLGVSALLMIVAPANRRVPIFGKWSVAGAILAGLALWALATTIWAPLPTRSLVLLFRVLALVVAGLYLVSCAARLAAEDRQSFGAAIGLSGVLFVAVFLFELVTGGALTSAAITTWNRITPWESPQRYHGAFLTSASAALVIFVWPSALAIARRTSVGWGVAFLMVASVAIVEQNMAGVKIAFFVSAIVGVMMWRWPRFSGVAIVAGLAAANMILFVVVYSRGAPGLVMWLADALSLHILPLPWQERIHIVAFTLDRIAEQPWFGWGFDASRTISTGIVGPFHGNPALPLHPHSLWLQVWLELGLVGVVLVLTLVGALVDRISASRAGPMVAATTAATVVSYLVVGNISFGAWQNWWLAISWLGLGFIVALVPRQSA